jgi:hypothetical protein
MLNWETIQSVASSGVQRGTPRQPRLAHQLSPLIFRKHDLHGRRTQIRRSRSYCSLEAFADHAAEFWLTIGGDPERALWLAQHNLSLRQTPRARALVRRSSGHPPG